MKDPEARLRVFLFTPAVRPPPHHFNVTPGQRNPGSEDRSEGPAGGVREDRGFLRRGDRPLSWYDNEKTIYVGR